MLKNNLLVVSLLLGVCMSYAQMTLNSPYSRFGIGNTTQKNNAFYESMGGLSNSYASPRFVNISNPALLSATASTTFDLGASFTSMSVSQGSLQNNSNNLSFNYMSFAFPIKRNYTFALGLRPYSSVNYSVETNKDLDATSAFKDTYEGNGGISAMSFTNSFAIIKDSVTHRTWALGLDAVFLAGNIQNSNTSILKLNGTDDISYTGVVNSTSYRGFNLNVGSSYRKEFFVGDVFQTIKTPKCDTTLQGQVAIVPRLFYDEQIETQMERAFETKYAIVFVNSGEIKLSSKIKGAELREELLSYYSSFAKKGFGVLVLESAVGASYTDIKNDFLDFVNAYKKSPKQFVAFEKDKEYSKEYLRYGSGIYMNLGASFETSAKMNYTGSEEINRIRTSTTDPFQTYALSQFSGGNTVLPSVMRFGFSLDKPKVGGNKLCGEDKKSTWLLGVDASLQNWSMYQNLGVNPEYRNTMRLALGASIAPNPTKINMRFKSGLRELLNIINYQGGLYYQTLPYMYNSKNLSELGINFGLSIPVNNDGGLMTWNIGLATRGEELKENYIKLGLGLTLNERGWFQPIRVGR